MSNRKKNLIYSVVLLSLVGIVYLYRKSQHKENLAKAKAKTSQKAPNKTNKVKVTGTTMGKIVYNVTYLDDQNRDFKQSIDSVLVAFNESLSTYIPSSEISTFNQGTEVSFRSPFFYPVLAKSQEIYRHTKGAFDPTVGPLVNAWGFGFKKAQEGKVPVDSLKQFVGFDKYLKFDKQKLQKNKPGVVLDFSAIAKGYAVDVVGEYLASQQIKNYAVEIGGEVRCRGKNAEGKTWLFGVKNPEYKAGKSKGKSSVFSAIYLDNRAMATSGNYENFYVKDGKKYAHTIDPATGYPVEHSLLSASVLAQDCMTADAYATAFMVMGFEKAKALLAQHKNLDAYLIYADDQGKLQAYMTKGAKKYLAKL
ncbi:FAD:protein FMN transferase [uncultured Microscilla sp.]|uniref:FAD:protein FMN transferase n=1 Tax=uncultured Microscilla sp. TaxID=432653 RepID=UPI00262B6418|nr:FAD:protein FMN transferase [uncultured Microscilla sp.]